MIDDDKQKSIKSRSFKNKKLDFTFNEKIEFKNVSFSYKKNTSIIKNFDLTIKKVKGLGLLVKVALVKYFNGSTDGSFKASKDFDYRFN